VFFERAKLRSFSAEEGKKELDEFQARLEKHFKQILEDV
jgi:hypothetical protein